MHQHHSLEPIGAVSGSASASAPATPELHGLNPDGHAASAPDAAQYEAGDPVQEVVLSLSPEALAVLEGALEPTAAARAASEALGESPLALLGRALSPTGDADEAPFELYGFVDIDGDGEVDGRAGSAEAEEAGDDLDGPDDLNEAQQQAEEERADDPNALSPEEEKQVAELAARDTEVRAHEFAHVAAGGGLTGADRFSYQTGPDGKRYAVGGSVSIDTSPGSTPEETISRAQRIRTAALAPADPSAQDRAVAAQAGQMEASARVQLATEQRNETQAALESSAEAGQPQDAPAIASTQAAEADGQEMVTAPETPQLDIRDAGAAGPEVWDPSIAGGSSTAVLHSESASTLASFESGSAATAGLYSLPPPDNALVAGPIDAQDVAYSFVR